MPILSQAKFQELQKKPEQIRNICIVAHVDHGKTTLADSLIASNGVISPRMAGKLRYMDSRKDEQERGITMKSSSISLYYVSAKGEYLINLIDSPGHVDFSSEVSTAVRLCDGAILVVDAVEGVCPQTQAALKQTWNENIKTVLILNKIDRLILEMKLTPLDAYIHLSQILEQVNAVMGELFATEVLGKTEQDKVSDNSNSKSTVYNWDSGLEDADDSKIYFSPDLGNVIFASAIDGWGFCIEDFVKVYSKKLNLDKEELQKCIWGDYYFNSKTKKIVKGAQEKAKKPIFVQFVLDNIWAIYDTICVRKDKEKLLKIIETIGVKITTRDLRHTDPKVQLQAVCNQWLPLANSVLETVCSSLPPANQLSEEKIEKLLCSTKENIEDYPPETQSLKKAFLECSSEPDAPLIVFISKMFPVERKILPQYKPQALTPEELAKRREEAKIRHAAKLAGVPVEHKEEEVHEEPEEQLPEDVFIAFARVFSGCLKKGCSVYVLGPKHDPATTLKMIKNGENIEENVPLKDLKAGHHVVKVEVGDLYIMMGRELELTNEAPAGNVVGIGGLEEYVLKSATLSSEIYCPAFSEMTMMAVPILRVAVEPARPSDLQQLVKGLKLLNQADACVQVLVQETGEHVLITAGEVHLERCLDDLRNRYAKIEINASEPIIPFRETVVPPPTVDMVKEAIVDQSAKKECDDDSVSSDGVVTMNTSNKQATIKILCAPLPNTVTTILEKKQQLIKTLDKFSSDSEAISLLSEDISNLNLNEEKFESIKLSDKTVKEISVLKENLTQAFKEAGSPWNEEGIVEKIWSFGPRRCGPNILFNFIEGYDRNVWARPSKTITDHKLYFCDSSFVNGFQLATLAGPICEEPMMGVAFIVKEFSLDESVSGSYGPLSGQIMSAVKDGCRRSFEAQPQRLMAAMYSCNIQVNAEVLGYLISSLSNLSGTPAPQVTTITSPACSESTAEPACSNLRYLISSLSNLSGTPAPQVTTITSPACSESTAEAACSNLRYLISSLSDLPESVHTPPSLRIHPPSLRIHPRVYAYIPESTHTSLSLRIHH